MEIGKDSVITIHTSKHSATDGSLGTEIKLKISNGTVNLIKFGITWIS